MSNYYCDWLIADDPVPHYTIYIELSDEPISSKQLEELANQVSGTSGFFHMEVSVGPNSFAKLYHSHCQCIAMLLYCTTAIPSFAFFPQN